MLLSDIHKLSVENGKESLAAYYHPKRKAKFQHLDLYEFLDQMGPIFGEFMRNEDEIEARKTLNLKMALFCNKQK